MSIQNETVTSFAPGHQLGAFEIIQPLSSGGQAQVYLARVRRADQLPLAELERRMRWRAVTPAFVKKQRLCTLKLPMPRWKENLRDEHTYLIDSNIAHPRLPHLLTDTGTTTGERRKQPKGLWFVTTADSTGAPHELPYIALVYEPGGSLKDLLEARGRRPLPPSTAVAIAWQVAEALEHMHTRCKLVHHDISPSNILFRQPLSALRAQPPDCVLIDLAAADSPRAPRLRHIYGKKVYLAPERRIKPPKPIDYPVDVYGLGVTLYEMLAGRVPGAGTMPTGDATAQLPHIRERQPAISEPLGNLVMQMVEHDPARRPTLPETMERLRDTPEASRPAALRGPWDTRARWQTLGGTLAILLIVLLIGVFGMGRSGAAAPASPAVPTVAPTATSAPTATLTPSATPIPPTSTPAFAPTTSSTP